jgi:hypothetical protein
MALKAGAVIGGVLLASIVMVTKAFMKFESEMLGVKAVLNGSEEDFIVLTNEAKRLGIVTRFTASEAAAGMGNLARAGFNTGEVMAATGGMLDLAAAGMLDVADAGRIVADVVRGFNLQADQASRIANVLALSAARTNTTVLEMGDAFSFVAPVAGALGVSVEQTAAMMGILADAGMKGSRAGTGLRRILAEMGTEISQRGVPALNELLQAGISVPEAFAQFGLRGAPAILALANRAQDVGSLTKALEEADGAAKKMAETRMAGVEGAFLKLKSAVTGLQIELGEQLAPTIHVIVNNLTIMFRAVTKAFTEVTDGGKQSIITFGSMTEALFAIIDTFVSIWNVVKRVGAVIAFTFYTAKTIVGAFVLAATVQFTTMFKLITKGLNLIGIISDETAEGGLRMVDAFEGSIIDGIKSDAGKAADAFSDIFAEQTDLDRWAMKTKRGIRTAIGDASKGAAEELAENIAKVDPETSLAVTLTADQIALGEATEDLQKWIDKQYDAVAVYGLTNRQAEIYRATQMGVADSLLEESRALDEYLTSLEKQNELLEKGKKLTLEMRTSAEKYSDKLNDLEELLSSGAISQETFSRALSKAREEFEKDIPEVQLDITSSIDSALGKFTFGQDAEDKIAKETLNVEKKQVDLLKKIENRLKTHGVTDFTGVLV